MRIKSIGLLDTLNNRYASRNMLYAAFLDKGFTVKELTIGEEEYAQFTSPEGKVWFTSASRITYPMLNTSITHLARQKDIACEYVGSLGINIPRSFKADGQEIKKHFVANKKVIVKPSDASGGKGLTLDVDSFEQLTSSLEIASRYSHHEPLIQEQVIGEEVRFIVFDNKVEAALLRQTPRVIGDGVSSIKELVIKENEQRSSIRLLHDQYVLLDKDNIGDIVNSLLVPKKDEIVELSKTVTVRKGASIYNVTEEVHVTYQRLVEGLSRSLGAGFLVVDVMMHNYKEASAADNYWFIEFNTAPALWLCYATRNNKSFDILDHLTRSIARNIA